MGADQLNPPSRGPNPIWSGFPIGRNGPNMLTRRIRTSTVAAMVETPSLNIARRSRTNNLIIASMLMHRFQSRIDDPIGNVGNHVCKDEGRCDHDDTRLDDRIVPGLHRLKNVTANPG
jgi:hypothetical protein